MGFSPNVLFLVTSWHARLRLEQPAVSWKDRISKLAVMSDYKEACDREECLWFRNDVRKM